MSTEDRVTIDDLPKAAVLAALFNATAPSGLGFSQEGLGPKTMTVDEADRLIKHQRPNHTFDSVYGRRLEVDLGGDSFDPQGFDRESGKSGSAQAVIDRLRKTRNVNTKQSRAESAAAYERNILAALSRTRGRRVQPLPGQPNQV